MDAERAAPSRPTEAPPHVLVVDDDEDIARFVEVNLAASGFRVDVARDGVEGLEKALELRPDLVLLDVMMPRMDGYEVARRLRADTRTQTLGIIMLTAKAQPRDAIEGLTAGADDYVVKPFDPSELLARVTGTLRRTQEMTARSPLTGLPGNVRIEDTIARFIAAREPFALLYVDVDYFKPFNDRYGFLRGDAAIRFAATVIMDAAYEIAEGEAFVGHIGGDDFVAICPPDRAEKLARMIVERFDAGVPDLYDPEDWDRGYVEVTNRVGDQQRFPLLALSIGIATTERRAFAHREEAVSVATELKQYAKREDGSSFAVDRREEDRSD